jgi:hypothetical protein
MPCALRLGEGPRALGFSILISLGIKGVYVKHLTASGARRSERRCNNLAITGAAASYG